MWKRETMYPDFVASPIAALFAMTYIQLPQRQFGAGVLKWFVYFRYVVKQRRLWLQCCDSAILEGGINYLIHANCIRGTMNWRCYQVWVRQCRDRGLTIITDERKDRRTRSLNECTVNKVFLHLLQAFFFFKRWINYKLRVLLTLRKKYKLT